MQNMSAIPRFKPIVIAEHLKKQLKVFAVYRIYPVDAPCSYLALARSRERK